ncbi:hypothetical protein G647_02807 [Cladophialophora carrionii CBS 160.54]|uniref:Uncharacterized protein n=1 Tax=Cladophialophora carrionii CBS 160.54 TaxID=1279043 RepID=V9DGQ3_9EURO|nr:uncharacterized protein G647_02807 [Cladophialophora carrionii CBS 160.54]ETI26030.1 hypothetical protein G647_02807 [Cladophialophora carrionii CBS 160.54]
MQDSRFLKLTPEEPRPHVPKPTTGPIHRLEGTDLLPLRRVSGLADLKPSAKLDASLPKFLNLTPDPPKHSGSDAHNKRDHLQQGAEQPACKSSGKKRSASNGGHEVGSTEHNEMPDSYNKAESKRGGGGNKTAQASYAPDPDTANIEGDVDVDWVNDGFQLPPRRFNWRAIVGTGGEPTRSV